MREDKEISSFQTLIFSILLRHKDELLKKVEDMIAADCLGIDVEKIIRKMFLETRFPQLQERIHAVINNEVTQIVPNYFANHSIELQINRYIEKSIENKIKECLKDHEALESIKAKKVSPPKYVIKKPDLLEHLKPEHKLILKYRDANCDSLLSISELAYKLDVSSARVRQLQSHALRRIEQHNKKLNGNDASPSYEYI